MKTRFLKKINLFTSRTYFVSLLAWRYLWGAKQKKSMSTVIGISFFGMLIGAASLTLTIAIMQGFEKVTHERLQSIHAQVIIRAFGNPINMQTLAPVLHEEFPEIKAFSPSALQQVFVQNHQDSSISTVVGIKGVAPMSERLVNALEKKIVPTAPHAPTTLVDALHNDQLLIGQKLAESLDLSVGDEVTLLFAPDEPKRKKINLASHNATISALFNSGIEEFDSGLIVASLDLFDQLFPEHGITEIHLLLHPNADEQDMIERLRNRLHIEVYSWKELYPALVSALKLEKYVMCIILSLITLIASMNIISLLLMQITQKRTDIAILQAMGMGKKTIQGVFMWMGLGLCMCAGALGIGLAWLACLLLQRFPFITLPDAYFVTTLPVHLTWHAGAFIFSLTTLLGLLAVWLALKQMESIEVTEVLRFNG